MRTILRRDDTPLAMTTSRWRTPNASARKATSAAFAFPSTGGAASLILCASP